MSNIISYREKIYDLKSKKKILKIKTNTSRMRVLLQTAISTNYRSID